MNVYKLLIDGINPEPWESPNASIGRINGKLVPRLNSPRQMKNYQEAIREEVTALKERLEIPLLEGEPFTMKFFFWRQIATHDYGGKKASAFYADATNLQKSLEDALQGILFDNDRYCASITSMVVEQGRDVEPAIVIELEPWYPFDDAHYAKEIRDELKQQAPSRTRKSNIIGSPVDDLF